MDLLAVRGPVIEYIPGGNDAPPEPGKVEEAALLD